MAHLVIFWPVVFLAKNDVLFSLKRCFWCVIRGLLISLRLLCNVPWVLCWCWWLHASISWVLISLLAKMPINFQFCFILAITGISFLLQFSIVADSEKSVFGLPVWLIKLWCQQSRMYTYSSIDICIGLLVSSLLTVLFFVEANSCYRYIFI